MNGHKSFTLLGNADDPKLVRITGLSVGGFHLREARRSGGSERVSCTIRARHPGQYLDNMAAITYPKLPEFSTLTPLDVLASLVDQMSAL